MNILENWTSESTEHRESFVIPDGCQDIIFVQKPNDAPFVYLSPLYNTTIKVELAANTFMMGFRLHPGCNVKDMDSTGLLSSISSVGALTDQIEGATHTDDRVSEALACIRSNGQTIEFCAKQLGVSTRTLQRLLSAHTSGTPSYCCASRGRGSVPKSWLTADYIMKSLISIIMPTKLICAVK